jgi:hypothetical protein
MNQLQRIRLMFRTGHLFLTASHVGRQKMLLGDYEEARSLEFLKAYAEIYCVDC